MSLFSPQAQANPSEFPDEQVTVAATVERTVQALESNKKAVHRWCWKGLIAFNLILWSLALPIAFLLDVA